jgi:hypothetical protein
MTEPHQLELFKSRPQAKPKVFRSADAPDLHYWPLPSGKSRVELYDGFLIDITRGGLGRQGIRGITRDFQGNAPFKLGI